MQSIPTPSATPPAQVAHETVRAEQGIDFRSLETLTSNHSTALEVICILIVCIVAGRLLLLRTKTSSNQKKLPIDEYQLHLVAVIAGIFAHLITHDNGIVITLVLEIAIFLHLFKQEYEEVLKKLKKHLTKDGFDDEAKDAIETFRQVGQLSRHAIALKIIEEAPSHPFLLNRFNKIIKNAKAQLTQISDGYYEIYLEGVVIPPESLAICQGLKSSAFCTSLEEHFGIFINNNNNGGELLKANYEAAERLPPNSFVRLFILDRKLSITSRVYNLMKENATRKIKVEVIFKEQVERLYKKKGHDFGAEYEKLDFGIWDEKLVMSITRAADGRRVMRVSTREQDRKEMAKLKAELTGEAKTFQNLLNSNHLRKPINDWVGFENMQVVLPAPNGPHNLDLSMMFSLVRDALPSEQGMCKGKISILGLTQGLIDAAKELKQNNSKVEVEVIDQRKYHQDLGASIKPIPANWINLEAEFKGVANSSDLVLGDDVLCNVAPWQLPLFFESIGYLLKPGGKFITRTTGIFDPDKETGRPSATPDEAGIFEWLRIMRSDLLKLWSSNSEESERNRLGAVYEIAWIAMHSHEYYRISDGGFDLGKWNTFVDFHFRSDEGFRDALKLSNVGNLQMTSLPVFRRVEDVRYPRTTSPYEQSEIIPSGISLEEYGIYSEPSFVISPTKFDVWSVWDRVPEYSELHFGRDIAGHFKKLYGIIVFTRS